MYKISGKSSKLPFRNSLFTLTCNNIVSSATVLSLSNTQLQKRKNLYHLIGDREGNTGFIELNREHKNNILSPIMLKELTRFLKSFEYDDTVRGVWLSSNGSKIFSKGTDFRMMAEKVANKKKLDAQNYLRDLYDFGIFMGKYNKPLLVNINGEIANAAASIFTLPPFALGNLKTKWYLNETSLGYIPDCGASYNLSRLEGELGTYLALTGSTLKGEDLIHTNFAYGRVFNDEDTKSLFRQRNTEVDRLLSSEEMFGNQQEFSVLEKKVDSIMFPYALKNEMEDRIKTNKENTKKVIAETIYKKKMADYANSVLEEQNEPLKSLNHLKYYADHVAAPDLLCIAEKNKRDQVHFNIEAINRCFRYNTMEEIFEALRLENSEWSKKTLKKLESKSPMSLKLTLKLLRDALNSQWTECFIREYRVASRRILDEEYSKAIKAILVDRNKVFTEWNYKKLEDIPNDLVEQYFRPLNEDLKIPEYDPKAKENSLYPVKEYYEEYPDVVRFFLNEENLINTEAREDYLDGLKIFFHNNNVDYKNANFSASTAREHFHKIEDFKRRIKIESQRLKELIHYPENLANFFLLRQNYIEKEFENKEKIKDLTQKAISKVFDNYLKARLDEYKAKCTDAHLQDKKEFFLKIKNIIFKYHFTEDNLERHEKFLQAMKNSNIALFFPENSSESFMNAVNPKYDPKTYLASQMTNFIKRKDIKHPDNDISESLSWSIYEIDEKAAKKHLKANKEEFDKTFNHREFYNELSPKFIERREEYWTKFFLGVQERKFRHEHMHELFQEGVKYTAVKDYLQSNIDPKKDNLHSLTYENPIISHYDLAKQILAGFTKKKILHTKLVPVKEEIQDVLNVIKELWKVLEDPDIDKKRLDMSKTSQNLEILPYTLDNCLKQFEIFIESNDDIKRMFSPFFENYDGFPYTKELQKKYRELFMNIYEKKIAEFLKTETQQKYAGAVLTKDGVNPYRGGDEMMGNLDYFIESANIIEFHRLILQHMMYALSTLLLPEVEKTLAYLQKVHLDLANMPRSSSFGEQEDARVKKELVQAYVNMGLNFGGIEDLEKTHAMMGRMTEGLGEMFNRAKDNVIFIEDRIVEFTKNRNSIEERTFAEKVIGMDNFYSRLSNEDLKRTFIQETGLENLTMKTEKRDEIDYKVFVNQKLDNIKYLHHDMDIWEDNVKPEERRNLINGTFKYLKELDSLATEGQYGKFSFLQKDAAVPKEFQKIPCYFDKGDQRKPLNVWLEEKIYDYCKKFFDARFNVEQKLTQSELIMLDKEMVKNFEHDKLLAGVQEELLLEFSLLKHQSGCSSILSNPEEKLFQKSRSPNLSALQASKIRNPEALSKFISFSIMLNEKLKNKEYPKDKYLDIFRNLDTLSRLADEAKEEPERREPTKKILQDELDAVVGVDMEREKTRKIEEEIGRAKEDRELGMVNEIGLVMDEWKKGGRQEMKEVIDVFREKYKEFMN